MTPRLFRITRDFKAYGYGDRGFLTTMSTSDEEEFRLQEIYNVVISHFYDLFD